jgi:polysaccharide export outer membrane protein
MPHTPSARLHPILSIPIGAWLAVLAVSAHAQTPSSSRQASAPPNAPPAAQQVQQQAAQQARTPAYTLHAGDQLEISVWKEPELQKAIVVRPDGRFSFPLVGEINAGGRPLADVQAEIEQKLKKYIPDPVVSVTLTEVGGNRIYVIGQVRSPGAFVMNPRVTVLQALSLAGGMTPFASVNNITVIRTSNGKQSTLPFRYEDVSRGRNLDQNVLLESGDVVVVP